MSHTLFYLLRLCSSAYLMCFDGFSGLHQHPETMPQTISRKRQTDYCLRRETEPKKKKKKKEREGTSFPTASPAV